MTTAAPFSPARPPAAAALQGSGRPLNPVVRWALYLYVFSIPFEMPHRAIPVEIPTLVGCLLLLATALDRRAAWYRIPTPLLWFGVYLWIFAVATLVNLATHEAEVLHLLVRMLQVLLLFWAVADLMAEESVRWGVLRTLAIACTLRAALQVFGIASTEQRQWLGGERITALGQNANLSAMILAAGLLALLGLRRAGNPARPWPALVRWPGVAIIAVAVIQTGSRGGLLALAVGVLALLADTSTPWARVRSAVAAAAVLATLVWGALHTEGMRNRLEATAVTGQLAGRERIYPAVFTMFRERPLIGWGPIENQYELERRLRERGYERRDVHNLVFELLTATGVVGALPFLVALGLCVQGAWRARHTARGALPFAMLAVVLTGTMSGTWIASNILWLVLSHAHAARPPTPSDPEPCAV